MKAGKDFDTKKSKGEVDNLMNIKKLLELNDLPYEDAYIISYEANTIQDINIKTDIKDCKLLVFKSFLELIFENNNSEINNGIEYIKNKFRNKAVDNIKHFQFRIDALNNDELNNSVANNMVNDIRNLTVRALADEYDFNFKEAIEFLNNKFKIELKYESNVNIKNG